MYQRRTPSGFTATRCSQSPGLIRRHLNLDLPHDGVGDFGLKLQHVREVVIEILGPEMRIGGGVNQLRRDTHAAAGATDGALDDGIDAKLAADLGQVLRRLLVRMTEVREITLNACTCARLGISCSVMPSEKYSSLRRRRGCPTAGPRSIGWSATRRRSTP